MIRSPELELQLPVSQFSLRIERAPGGGIFQRTEAFDGYEVRLSGHLPRRYAVIHLTPSALKDGFGPHDVGLAADLLIAELEAELALLKAARKVPRE